MGMAHAYFGGDRIYEAYLFDGYVTNFKGAKWREREPWNKLSFERGMAEMIYRRLKGMNLSPKERSYRPDTIHVYVFGNSDWLNSELPAPLRTIAEDELDSSYRIIIAAWSLLQAQGRYDLPLGSTVRDSGLTLMKKHKDRPTFEEAATTLLGLAYDYYDEERAAPTPILRDFGVPLEFCGDQT